MRAAISACTVSGISFAARSSPHSATLSMTSSRNSGLPPVLSRARASWSAEIAPSSASASISTSLSAAPSGSSSIAVARTRPPPQSERTSSSSGRARHMIISEPSRTQDVMCSISSSSGSSAQWMSSKTRISGWVCDISCAHSRAAQEISCWLRSPWTASSTPVARPSRSATASAGQHSRSFSIATSSGSSSAMSAAPLTISASGQYVMLSPYGRQRPVEHRRSLERGEELVARRLFPTPGSP